MTAHLLYSAYGADMEDASSAYDPASHILVYAELRLDFPLNNHTHIDFFVHHPGAPPLTQPTLSVPTQYKGESLDINKEGTGLRWLATGHNTAADPNPHPAGSRLTTLETDVIPNIFPA